jgi:hypothetical protein
MDGPFVRIQKWQALLFRHIAFGSMCCKSKDRHNLPCSVKNDNFFPLWTVCRRPVIFLVSVPCSRTKSCHFPPELQLHLFHFSYNLVALEWSLDKGIDHPFSIGNSVAFERSVVGILNSVKCVSHQIDVRLDFHCATFLDMLRVFPPSKCKHSFDH